MVRMSHIKRPLHRYVKKRELHRVKRLPPEKRPSDAYAQLWRVVDGAVNKALQVHPDYLTDHGRNHNNARRSIVKRVVGDIMSYSGQTAKVAREWDRPGCSPAVDNGGPS
jgi:hypothetical protein